ncbi:MAG: hypothetical protein MT490_11650 [Sphingomonas sp.]|uniref:hypothetical protein n=1 Tax=Sphingomonas sp. TaxID=28214 RepID=UPI0022759F83|nr:hypothetical protein [Sphingomonas sp.]MCX8476440.1 hypothetical protein [Sphingomonas sp.]
MNHEKRVRESERAAVERWFAHSPLGTMFSAGDGRMLPIPADAIAPWREEAFAIIDKFIVDSRPPPQWAMFGIIFAFASVLLALQPVLGLDGSAIGAIVMGGLLLWHGADLHLLWRYRRDLKALRGRIAASLALRAPMPAEFADRYRRGNAWRTALHLWVGSLIALALLATHFVPPDAIGPAAILGAIGAIGIAWLLYFLSRRTDLVQARAPSLASRPTPPISRP